VSGYKETRSDPENAARLSALAQKDIDDQWHYYEQMAGVERDIQCNGEAARHAGVHTP
jgi:hypothetical protein